MAGAKKKKVAAAEAVAEKAVETMVPENVLVVVQLPDNCKKNNLSVDALDSYTRELAAKTFVTVDGKPLLCRAVKFVEQGGESCLQLTIRPECFESVG